MEEIETSNGSAGTAGSWAGVRRERVVLAAAVCLVGVVAVTWWGRSAPAMIAPPATDPAEDGRSPSSSEAASALYVHVAGAVRAPGLYGLAAGARVADAVAAAGGARPKGDLDALNLAQLVTDGMKIEVPRRGAATAVSGTQPTSDPGSSGAAAVSLNSADQAALEAIPGIGPVKAAAIVSFRSESGPFTAIEQVMEVSGIGPATYEQMRPFVTL